MGPIDPGKLADLRLLAGDPTVQIGDAPKTALAVKDGIVYKPQEAYSAIGVLP